MLFYEIDIIVCSLPNRSEYIRQAIALFNFTCISFNLGLFLILDLVTHYKTICFELHNSK